MDPSLEDLAHADDEDVRRRARLVRDTLALGPTQAAREHGVTRQTAAAWTSRYRAGGAARLRASTQRHGATEQMRHAILTAPLWMPTTKWTSRSIARALGTSQSTVTRAWEPMRSPTRLVNDLAEAMRGRQPGLLGLLVTGQGTVLACQLTTRTPPDRPAPVDPMVRRPLRAVLASDLVRHRITRGTTADETSFWDKVTSAAGPDATIVAVASERVAMPPEVAIARTCENQAEWQSLFSFFARDVPPPALDLLRNLEDELRRWARTPHRAFAWTAPAATTPEIDREPSTHAAMRRPGPERALADQIIVTIRHSIADGRLAGGDRVTERYLAGRLRTTRAQVRSALRVLGRDGLLTITTGHAAVVPVPTANDVVETYAARRALGALVIRAAIRWSPQARRSVLRSLDTVVRHAMAGDVYRTGDADIEFQNTLAEASGLERIAPMLRTLADHLRMFIAVMGLDYAYPIDAIVHDDRGIFDAIENGDGDTAVELWRTKMNDAANYMLEQLSAATQRPTSTT